MERNEILAVAIDTIKGRVDNKFSANQTSEELRQALIDLNGGSTKINAKTFYRGTDLFAIVEELIPVIIEEGINTATNPLFDLVEYRNLADGDLQEFDVEGDSYFVVSESANGIQGIRRQRISEGRTVTVPTKFMTVRVYENLGRLLAGRIDFSQFVDGVAKAFANYETLTAYKAFEAITSSTAGLSSTYVLGGTPTESDIVTLIEHVEAATGKAAKIYGTKGALRKLSPSITGELYKDDMYKMGYYGNFNGTPCIRLNQAHKAGTDTFILTDSKIWVIAGDDKPIKLVREGNGILTDRDASQNADLTREYFYGENIGVGIVVGQKFGVSAVS